MNSSDIAQGIYQLERWQKLVQSGVSKEQFFLICSAQEVVNIWWRQVKPY